MKNTKKKLFLLKQTENSGLDVYDSCIVCAKNRSQAIKISMNELEWVENELNINCKIIGTANYKLKIGMVLASFNAG